MSYSQNPFGDEENPFQLEDEPTATNNNSSWGEYRQAGSSNTHSQQSSVAPSMHSQAHLQSGMQVPPRPQTPVQAAQYAQPPPIIPQQQQQQQQVGGGLRANNTASREQELERREQELRHREARVRIELFSIRDPI
ncbi:hypothetical protein HDU76_007156 [Blyttiomyces sp. JEL0837]|nr:hypothetical protein HDU76_007156 [Blyttiomyces sp. JEL0837]